MCVRDSYLPRLTAGGSGIGKVIGGVQVLPAGAIGPDGRAAIIRDQTLTSPTDASGPESTAAHSYAKVKKNHPYAHVKLPKSKYSTYNMRSTVLRSVLLVWRLC